MTDANATSDFSIIKMELAAPQDYDERYAKWRIEDLPIVPGSLCGRHDNWHYKISEATRKQFNILKSLMNRPDVTSLVCATDVG